MDNLTWTILKQEVNRMANKDLEKIDSKPIDEHTFYMKMDEAIKLHEPIYRDTWKVVPLGQLENRLLNKVEEFKLTKNPNKLVSIANLAMLMHKRLEQNG